MIAMPDQPWSAQECERLVKAPYYELVAWLEMDNCPPGGIRLLEKAIATYEGPRERLAIDVGANTGFVTRYISKTLGMRAIGLDLSVAMMEAARRIATIDGAGRRTAYVCGDAVNLPIGSASVDLVVCGGSLAFMPNKAHVVSEWHRILRPGGTCICIEFICRPPCPQRILDAALQATGANFETMSVGKFRRLFTEPGFVIVEGGRRNAEAARGLAALRATPGLLRENPRLHAVRLAAAGGDGGAQSILMRLSYLEGAFREMRSYLDAYVVNCRKAA